MTSGRVEGEALQIVGFLLCRICITLHRDNVCKTDHIAICSPPLYIELPVEALVDLEVSRLILRCQIAMAHQELE